MNKSITQERLKELLTYSEKEGKFYWKVSPSNNIKIGDEAGKGKVAGYNRVSLDNKSYLVHRLVWLWFYGYMPKEIDHINHNRSDNRLNNLREVTHIENGHNVSKKTNNTTGYTGVVYHKATGKWLAQIMINHKNKYLGLFSTIEEAVEKRKEAEKDFNFYVNHGL